MTRDPTNKGQQDAFFAGSGEVRALCRAMDWSATRLGPVETWPQALRLAVRLCLDSKTATAVWAGSEFILIYNEGYEVVLASKHPSALGRPAREVWPEVWSTLRGAFEQVAVDGNPVRHLHRHGRDEEAYFTYSLSPIREDDGSIVGVFNVTEETSRAVIAREEHEEFLSLALAGAHIGAWQMGALDAATVQRNLQHAQIFGYEEPLPHWDFETFLAHVLPEDRETVGRQIRLAIETGATWTVECRIRRRDRAVRWISSTGSCFREAEGEPPKMAGIVQDITERKQAEEEVRSSRARKAFLLRLGDTLQPLDDPAEVQAAAAGLLCEHLGANRVHYAEAELDAEHVVVLQDHAVGVPDRAGRYALADFPRSVDEIRAGRTFVSADLATDARLGPEEKASYLTLPAAALVLVPIQKHGRLVGLLSVHRASAHAWSEDEVKIIEETAARTWEAVLRTKAERALRVSEERYRQALETMSEGYAILSPDWTYLFVNKVNAEQAQSRPEDMVGRNMLEVIPGVEKSPFFEAYRRCMEERMPQRVESSFTFEDGSSAWFEAVAEPVAEGISVRAQDITARKRDEHALRESEEALQEADRRKDQFFAVLSHELRNPLAPIKNGLYILDRAPVGGEQARRARAVIERQVDQLTHLVDDLLDVTRITRGKVQLQRRRLDLNELVRRSLEDHRPLLDEAELELEVRLSPQQVFVNADRNRIEQSLGNLLMNAAKFTPPGGRVTVTLTVDASAGQAVLSVSDQGAGIAPELLPQLFEPFIQADATLDRSQGGLGLGLALVRGLVEQHGGSVTATSEGGGRGAEFTVRLPLDVAAQQPQGDVAGAAVGTLYRRVLVIEDNEDAADTLQEVLELDGHEVSVAYSGPEGLAKARGFHPDLVLCDIGLPGMDGYTVARLFRADEELKHAHLVAVSGYALPEDLRRAAEAGFERHIAKPLTLEKIEEVVREVR